MKVSTVILGAGAAGMMAAAHSGPDVLVIDHAKAAGEKIRISGGGRCNFTNTECEPSRFLGNNPHFAKSALSRYTQWDFISLVAEAGIAYHEKTLGQLFCDNSAKDIVALLRREMDKAGAQLWLETSIKEIAHRDGAFHLTLERNGRDVAATADALVVATGGKSIPKMGATGIAYDIARQFGHEITDTRAGLVPFTFSNDLFKPLAGVATPVRAGNDRITFDEALLFTHRGLSGPSMLQLSSYWYEGEEIAINLFPITDPAAWLKSERKTQGRRNLTTVLAAALPARLVDYLAQSMDLGGNVADLSDKRIDALCAGLTEWRLTPQGTEGYRTAEVTVGGVDTDGVSSKTMESKHQSGLYFIGEALDVTGWLGGYNFQWAWSSGVAAGRAIEAAQRRA